MTAIPNREKVKQAYDLRQENPDMSAYAIAKVVGAAETTVQQWLRRPERFDWYLDEIAIERALKGDLSAYNALTLFELQAVYAKLSEELQAYREEFPNGDNRGGGCLQRYGQDETRVYAAVTKWERAQQRQAQPREYVPRNRAPQRTPELVAKVKALREEGHPFRVIGERLGITYDTARRAGSAAA